MTSKEAIKELKRINKLPKNEKKFAKSLFLYKYLELVANKVKFS